jgi:hypothetical protein
MNEWVSRPLLSDVNQKHLIANKGTLELVNNIMYFRHCKDNCM